MSENGATLLEGGAPYTDEVCLPNGCYTLEMFDSCEQWLGAVSLTITNPDGEVVGTYTLNRWTMDSASFCVEDYDGPEPTVDDYIQVVSDELNITAVSDADAGFDWPTPVCSGGDPIVLIPNEGSGEWTVDCDGCFDEATLTIDPAIAGDGGAITHVLEGTCIDDVEETEMFIAVTPRHSSRRAQSRCVTMIF